MGVNRALIIANGKYCDPAGAWMELDIPERDGRGIKEVLVQQYGYAPENIVHMENATRRQIYEAMKTLIEVCGEEDQVLIFYAGHGYYDRQDMRLGYWIPIDAEGTDDSTFISNSDVKDRLVQLSRKSRHVLLLSDSCFSGDFLSSTRNIRITSRDIDQYFTRKHSAKSCQVITSGGKEAVQDEFQNSGHSPFAYHLLNKLRANDSKYYSATELALHLEKTVCNAADQTPQHGILKGSFDENGEFFFIRADAPARATAQEQARSAPRKETGMELVQTFRLNMREVLACFVDGRQRLWAANREQVKMFAMSSPQAAGLRPLPEFSWKCFLPGLWQENFVCSTWEGSIYMLDLSNPGKFLYQAKYDDLPAHRLAVGARHELLCASWDGRITGWEGEGKGRYLATIPHLPLWLSSQPDGTVAVVDQNNCLTLLDAQGRKLWEWTPDAPLREVWFYEAEGLFLAWVGDNLLLSVKGGRQQSRIELSGEVAMLSHRCGDSPVDRWTAIAMREGAIDWLCWSPFRLLKDNRVALDFAVRQIEAVYDPRRQISMLAIGLTGDGELFSVVDKEVQVYSDIAVEKMIADPSGKFCFCLCEERAEVYRNPLVAQ